MWEVSRAELLSLKGGGGEPFLQFVSHLIHASAAAGRLPASEIDSTLRANVRDGGVDIRVRAAVPEDPVGWLGEATCWQTKAVEANEVTPAQLREEINKPFAAELIRAWHAYRLAILGDITPEKKAEWEAILLEEARKLDAAARVPRVIGGQDLAVWASQYLSVVMRLRKPASSRVFGLDTWSRAITAWTPVYAPVPAWDTVRRAIVEHSSLDAKVLEVCLPVRGEAGVGKSRLAYEVLRAIPASALVVYTNDEEAAVGLAYQFAVERLPAILIGCA